MPDATVYITGASGFVGSNLLAHLKTCPHVRPVTVGRTGCDLTYDQLESERLEDGSTVIHLAGKAHDLRNVSEPGDYEAANLLLTRRVHEVFARSAAEKFVFISSVKAVADAANGALTETSPMHPTTPYGISKMKAEDYLRRHQDDHGRAVYVLRPCLIHGPGNKGNLKLLNGLVTRRVPYPLGAYENERSLLTVQNLCFVLEQIATADVEPGTYNVADDTPISTTDIVAILSSAAGKRPLVISPPRALVGRLARVGDFLRLPVNSERVGKLTESYVVCNAKLLKALGRSAMPISTVAGLRRTALAWKAEGTC